MAKILHRSFRGEDVDLEHILMNQGESIAIGNAGLNARGDLIDARGRVLKTSEQIDREYKIAVEEEKRLGKNNKKFSISGNYQEIESFITPEQIHRQLQEFRANQEQTQQPAEHNVDEPVVGLNDITDMPELNTTDTQLNKRRRP
jgi:hypothetical protein